MLQSDPIQLRRVRDEVGITYGIPLDWEAEAGDGSMTLLDGRADPVAEITHRSRQDGDDPVEELAGSGLCERQPEQATVGGVAGARCANRSGTEPAAP